MAKDEIKQRELLRRPLQKSTSALNARDVKLGAGSTMTDSGASQESRPEIVTVFDSSIVPQPFLDSDLLAKINGRQEQCTVRGEKPRQPAI
ncbi:hypothetical protein GJ744_011155 [Endocarpon pusillum]|uniref:Uncharacterized protein n=1 Tax=Endocarpon pusillum TaxID=364733 RepID=A0A8H7AGC1_9EURO|nr:hypothetical protein GJ744_011155 [Endocarpon pusillum]